MLHWFVIYASRYYTLVHIVGAVYAAMFPQGAHKNDQWMVFITTKTLAKIAVNAFTIVVWSGILLEELQT